MDWSSIPVGPEDAVFRITRLYNECSDPQKVSLGIGAYRNGRGKPHVLEAVVRARTALASQPAQEWTHEYQPIAGHGAFMDAARELAFGPELVSELGGRLVGLQAMSGTGACRLAFEFVSRFGPNGGKNGNGSNNGNGNASGNASGSGSGTILLSNPTWANHKSIAKFANLSVSEYRYIDSSDPTHPHLDLPGLLSDLRSAPRGTPLVLHMCAHNPTGVDPTLEQWQKIADLVSERDLIPIFDNAYQGFASGDLDADAASLRMFVRRGLSVLVCCSFAKNMGLYGERVGALHIVAPDKSSADAALSQLKIEARAMYSNPPLFGVQVAHKVMTDPELRKLWEDELRSMSSRIRDMRWALRSKLESKLGVVNENGNNDQHSDNGDNKTSKSSSLSWKHVTDQIGMFSYTGLTKRQVRHCAEYGSVFLLDTGRASMAGVNQDNVEHVASTIANAIQNCPPLDLEE